MNLLRNVMPPEGAAARGRRPGRSNSRRWIEAVHDGVARAKINEAVIAVTSR